MKIFWQTSSVTYKVSFAKYPQNVETLEGVVSCLPGDAILTGVKGESWPVQREAFFRKYEPAPGIVFGEDGLYKKRLAFVIARLLQDTEAIVLSEGRGVLNGQVGDWCLTYGFGNQAFIRDDILSESYTPSKSISVCIGVDSVLFASRVSDLVGVEAALRQALPHTPIFFTSLDGHDCAVQPLWLRVSDAPFSPKSQPLNAQAITLISAQFLNNEPGSLLAELSLLRSPSAVKFTKGRIQTFFEGFFSVSRDISDVQVIAAQLAALDEFNAVLQRDDKNEFFVDMAPEALSARAHSDLRRVGAVADALAGQAQKQWQQLVLADTKAIASVKEKAWFARPWATGALLCSRSIATLGLLAALGLAGFSELGDGCDAADALAWIGCSTQGWKQWVGDGGFALYIGALALAWWRYATAKAQKIEGKHQDYRLLAECLRAQYVLGAMGVGQCAADDFSVDRSSESSWVLLALRSLLCANPTAGQCTKHSDAANAWAMQAFVQDQIDYHENTLIARRENAAAVLSAAARWGTGLFLICLVLLTIHVVARFFQPDKALFSPMGQHLLLIAQVAGLALWATMRKVIDTLALEQEIQRGKIVLDALKQASVLDRQSIVTAAQLFVQDQAAWHALRRSKPIEATTGGG